MFNLVIQWTLENPNMDLALKYYRYLKWIERKQKELIRKQILISMN